MSNLNIHEWLWQWTVKLQRLTFTFMLDLWEDYSWCSIWLKAGSLIHPTFEKFHVFQGYISKDNLRPKLHSYNASSSYLLDVTWITYLNMEPIPLKIPGFFLPGLFLLSKTAFSDDCLGPPRTDPKALGPIPGPQSVGMLSAWGPSSSATVWGKNRCLGSRCQTCSSCLILVSEEQLPTLQANNTKHTRVSIQTKQLAEKSTISCLQF